MDWRHHSACLDEDPELFFPIGSTGPAISQVEEAKVVCRRCDVREQCLTWALGRHERGRASRAQASHRPRPHPHGLTPRPSPGCTSSYRGPVPAPRDGAFVRQRPPSGTWMRTRVPPPPVAG
jgi:hypothetical protein